MTLWKKEENQSSTPEQDENEATFDIMLCDNCDAEFYSEEAFSVGQVHFKILSDIRI